MGLDRRGDARLDAKVTLALLELKHEWVVSLDPYCRNSRGMRDAQVDQNVTLNTPFVTVLLPVAPVPARGTRLSENVPLALVDVNVVTVMVPLPSKGSAVHSIAPEMVSSCSEAVAVLS
jgi:hypothetical protein